MKKFTLLLASLATIAMSAQYSQDFDGTAPSLGLLFGGGAGVVVPSIVANPTLNGDNPLASNVLQVVENAPTTFFWSVQVNDALDGSLGQFYSFNFLAPKATGLLNFRVVGGGEVQISYTVTANEWATVVFDMGSATDAGGTGYNIITDVTDNPTTLPTETYYYDNITQGTTAAAAQASTATLDIADLDAIGVNAYYTNTTSTLNLSAKESIASVSIYDLSGKVVSTTNASTKNVAISLSELSSGIYIAEITSSTGASASLKIAK